MIDHFTNFFSKVKVLVQMIFLGSLAFFFGPFYVAVNVDFSEQGRRGCWGCSLSLAGLLAGKPCQLKVLSEALLLNRRVLLRENYKFL